MTAKGDSEGFVSSPLDGQGARHKDSYYPMCDENAAELRYTDISLVNPFVTSPGDLRDLGRSFRYEPRRSTGVIA